MADIFDDELEVPESEDAAEGQADEAPEAAEADEGQAESEPSSEQAGGTEAPSDEGQADWYWPGKFRTPDDLRRAYEALEKERGRLAQELGQHRQTLQQYLRQAAERRQGESQEDANARRRELLRKMLADPEAAIREMAERIVTEREQKQYQRRAQMESLVQQVNAELAQAFPDWNDLAPAMEQEFRSNPLYLQLIQDAVARDAVTPQLARAIGEQVYWAAKGRLAVEGQKAAKNGRSSTDEAAAKLVAATAAAGKPVAEKMTDEEKLMAELIASAAEQDEF
ncbi:MAG TPA: hypothetical protein VF234_07255 [Limnochordia bacterium]